MKRYRVGAYIIHPESSQGRKAVGTMIEDENGQWVKAEVAISLENRLNLAMKELEEAGLTSTKAMYEKAQDAMEIAQGLLHGGGQ